MKLVNVHRILKFKQSDWLKKHIDFNADKRNNAVNSFEKDFLKSMNNSFYGKTTENLRKRVKVRLVNNAKDCKKYVIKPSFVLKKIFSKKFVAIHQIKPVLIIDKPIYVGLSVLGLSNLLMYEFHYKYIQLQCVNRANLLFTDADSLVYEIATDDVHEDFYENKNLFDFSDYPEDSKFFDPVNKKAIGNMKDEIKRKIISEFVGLKSKMYSLVIINKKEMKKEKSINKNVVKNIRHKKYVVVLFNKNLIRHEM